MNDVIAGVMVLVFIAVLGVLTLIDNHNGQ